jgi:F-type H+-transporting ATPase subunit delta
MDSIASRYGLALYKLAEEKNEFSSYLERFDALLSILSSTPDFIHALKNAFYSKEEKTILVRQVLPSDSFGLLGSFVLLLLKNHRIQFLEPILIEAKTLCQQATDIQHGVVYSTTPLSVDQLRAISKAMQEKTTKTLTLTNTIDPSLIGGIKVEIGGKVYDSSLLAQVDAMKQRLLKRGS